MRVREIDHIVLIVSDVERSLAWYTDLLGMEGERVEQWRAGDAPFPSVRISDAFIIDLFAGEATGRNLDHVCFVVDRDEMEGAAADGRFDVLEGPAPRWGARGMGTSYYVSDPDGNTVELRCYDDR